LANHSLDEAGTFARAINEALRRTLDRKRVMERSSETLFSIDVEDPGE
jgi:hypothetical protein